MATDPLKILAIDDNPDNLITLRAVVRDTLPEAAVVTASNGPQGIAQAQAEDPDVILLDIVMPGMDGYEACRRLKADERTRHIPVVFLTALRADRESRVRALEAGAEAFLAKPLEEIELTAQIRAMAKIKAANVLARQEQGRLAALVAERTAELERELAERRLVEAAERLHAAQLRGIYRATPVGIGMLVNRVFQEVNDTLCRMTGYVREELLGQSARILYPTQDEFDHVGREKYRQIAQQAIGTVETHWQRKDSEIIDVLLSSAALDPADLTRGVTFSALDITERKRTERALRESEDKFKYVFDHSIVAKSLTLPTGEVNVNQAFADMLGYTRAEFQNRKWQDFSHPDDIASTQEVVRALLAGERESQRFKKRYLRRDGGVVWTDVSTSLRRDHEGKPLYFMTAVSDITAQVQAEAALRLERDRAQGYLDIAGVMLMAFDATGKVTLINQRGTEILGCRQEEIIGQDWFAGFLPLRIRDQVRVVFAKLIAGEVEPVAYYENPVLTAGGEERIVAWHNATLKDAAGRISGILSSGEDITERKRAEDALRESEANLRKAQAVANVGSWVWHIQANRLEGSDQMYRIFGIEMATFTGDLADVIARAIHPDDRPAVESANLSVINEEKPIPLEYRVIWPDGTERVVWAEAGELILDAGGKPLSLSGIVLDITERKRAEAETQAARAKLEAALASMTDAVFISDREGRFTNFNDAFATFHRFNSKEECATTLAEYPAFLDVYMASGEPTPLDQWAVPRALRGETGVGVEYGLRRKDTGESWFGSYSFAPIRVKEGAIVGSVVVGHDITERKRAEDALREREDTLQKIFSILPIGLWFADKDGRLLRGNPAGIAIWGAEPHVAPAEYGVFKARRLPSGQETAADDSALARTIREGITVVDELLEIDTFDGAKKIILNYTAPVLDEHGAVLGAIIVNQDITERKQAEDKIRQQLDELKRWYNVTLERETRTLEIKHEVNELLRRLGEPIRYPSAEK